MGTKNCSDTNIQFYMIHCRFIWTYLFLLKARVSSCIMANLDVNANRKKKTLAKKNVSLTPTELSKLSRLTKFSRPLALLMEKSSLCHWSSKTCPFASTTKTKKYTNTVCTVKNIILYKINNTFCSTRCRNTEPSLVCHPVWKNPESPVHRRLDPDAEITWITYGRLCYKDHEGKEITGRTRCHSCDVIHEPVFIPTAEKELYPSSLFWLDYNPSISFANNPAGHF